MGEMLGEDAGTAIRAELSLTVSPLTHLTTGRPVTGWPRLRRRPPRPLATARRHRARRAVCAAAALGRAAGGRLAISLATEAGLGDLAEALLDGYPLQAPTPNDNDGTAPWTIWREALPDGEL